MRLIDADALRADAITRSGGTKFAFDNCYPFWQFSQAIAQAPTVEAVPIPCKVGDEVWCVRDTRVYSKPVKGTVTEIYFRGNMDMCIVVRRLCRGRWGERVFATEQEAQAAIDRRLNDEKNL